MVVSADMQDALVSVDGQARGFTPAVIGASAGSHRVTITRSGFLPVEQTVVVKPNGQTKVDVELTVREEVSAASRADESVDDAPASVTIISPSPILAAAASPAGRPEAPVTCFSPSAENATRVAVRIVT